MQDKDIFERQINAGRHEHMTGREFRLAIAMEHTHGPLCDRFLNGEKMPCFLGLSPNSSFSNRSQLAAILQWLAPRSQRILVLEGSYFSRWDLMVFDQLSLGEAETRVQHSIKIFERRLRNVATVLGLPDVVVPLQWPEVLEHDETRSIQAALRAYAKSSAIFSKDIDTMLAEFLSRARPASASLLSPCDHDVLTNYIYEELAVFLYLIRTGYPLEVYPGSDIDIMERIVAGTYPNFPITCPNRSHISIRLERN